MGSFDVKRLILLLIVCGVVAAFGATAQNVVTVVQGTYTPTLFNTTNVAASTAHVCNYLRIGNTVEVWGQYEMDATSTALTTVLGMEVPIASDFADAGDASGLSMLSDGGSERVMSCKADTTNDRFTWTNLMVNSTNQTYSFHAIYKVQ
jgi:hypothetical protein